MPMANRLPLASAEIRVLFRFRDLVANTLEEHRKILADKKACWWGWWKRPNEPRRDEVWESLRYELDRCGEVVIGLFDSGAEQDAVAVRRARVIEIVPPKD